MVKVRRSLWALLVSTIAVASAAWGRAACEGVDQPEFPASRSPADIRAWITQETDLDADAVVAVTPGAVTAILSYIPTPEGLQRINLRSEATDAEAYAKDGVLSWTSVVEINCKTKKARLGRTVAYAERNLVGEGRETVAASPAWITPFPGGAAYNAMREACGGKVINPLNAPRTAQAGPVPQRAEAATAAPAQHRAQIAAAAPRPARVGQALPAAERAPAAKAAPATPAPPPVRMAQAATAPPAVSTPPPRPAPPAPPPPPPPPPKRGAAPPASAIVVAPPAKVTSTHPVTFAPAEPQPASEPSESGQPGRVSVQISASLTPAEAKQSLAAAQSRAGALPPGVAARVVKAQVRGKTWYRAQFGGFQSTADAQGFCKSAGAHGCLVKTGPTARR